MSEETSWGPCVSCKWWQVEPDASVAYQTVGQCIDESLQPYTLRISGNGGCNRYIEGEPARAAGASEMPPVAEPSR
ncbi:hypothetical protein Pan216_28630 [Planctomycetes bacterium Pan216]|uniref:Uncharacterized protein n=1 Tax=Kolteria novifilia TaxID=2527975 RepID=A0A518B4U8_9BACT|nr:hypothetical protein Pan216_28630 [Planctomycetes bacterium Pan216]